MSVALGDRVHLTGLGTGVVREIRGGDRYAVEIKGRIVIANGSALESAASGRRRMAASGGAAAAGSAGAAGTAPAAPAGASAREPRPTTRPGGGASRSLDLHGRTVAEALDDLERFVNDALLDGCGEVRIIHGRSGGRVKAAVYGYLRTLSAVRRVALDPHNAGVTIATF